MAVPSTQARLVASLEMGIPRPLRLDATIPIPRLVEALNEFRPEMMMAYPSIASLLAEEQVEGRLRIAPKIIVTGGEWRTDVAEEAIVQAWGVIPFNDYGLTEGPVGIDCALHRGVHVFEDMCVIEVVDEANRPVPAGTSGARVLFTNLFAYALPLIRYQVSDFLTASSEPCPCGRPFALISRIEGRLEEVLYLKGRDGRTVRIHANHFIDVMKAQLSVRRWRVVERDDGLEVLVMLDAGASAGELTGTIATAIEGSLRAAGVAELPVQVRLADELQGAPELMGKFKLVESQRSRPSATSLKP